MKPGRRLWIAAAGVVLVWLLIAGMTGPLAGKLSSVQTNDEASFLPASAEATRVAELEKKFSSRETIPAIVVYTGAPGDAQKLGRIAARDAQAFAKIDGVTGRVAGPIPSKDGKAFELIVPITSGTDSTDGIVNRIRDRAAEGLPRGTESAVTGPAAFAADLTEAFAGIDGILLLVAVTVVLIILVLVYRSPILPFAVLASALFALAAASGAIYLLADRNVLTLNGQSQGILFILVVGAATDYALLLTARFREELREHESRFEAMLSAWKSAAPAILASGMTVILSLLCLLVSDLNSTRSLGPIGAIGIAFSILSALTFLPALLTLLGRTAFWPRRPHHGSEHPEQEGIWARLAGLVSRHPRRLWIVVGACLLVFAAFLPTLKAGGTSQPDLFLHSVPSVEAQQVADRHFPGGSGSPVVVIGPASELKAMVKAAGSSDGVSVAYPVAKDGSPVRKGGEPAVVDGLTRVQATLKAPADSEAAISAVKALRDEIHSAVPKAEVGGTTATALDTQNTAKHDRNLVIPIVLAVIALLLALLLRALVMALLLLATVVLSFAATLGVSAIIFNHVLGFPGADPSVPLFGFVFLVALGIDYNIFLMTRVREESNRRGTRQGVLRGLIATGGVITSAGVVLAATFSALAVIPLLFLAQVAFIVAFGVLLDTLVVRSILVPSLVYDLDHRAWWPSRLPRRSPNPDPPPGAE
ncbi:MAG: MMPL family transporter [Solirubrobacterales bacterium]|nr:MMPL family transporter [Solirubrobacterales bacterium]